MPTQPLTHHEILALVEPFSRCGRHLDLGASNRLERRLLFKPIEHAHLEVAGSALRETLQLDHTEADRYRLTRVLATGNGLAARLVTQGSDPGGLLARLQSIPLARQFRSGAGYVLAQSHRLEPDSAFADGSATDLRLILTGGVVQVGGLTLKLAMPEVRGSPADLDFVLASGDTLKVPQDLLAVLGWRWTYLARTSDGWRSIMKVRRREPEQSRQAELDFERTAAHLAQTFAEPPARFHERLVAARWTFALRRSIPLLATCALIGGAVAAPHLGLAKDSVIRMLIFNAPPLLMMLVFCMREMPRLEIPPLPRRGRASQWRESQSSPEGTAPSHDLQPG